MSRDAWCLLERDLALFEAVKAPEREALYATMFRLKRALTRPFLHF